MLSDIKHKHHEKTNEFKKELSFLEFVQMYINHRPAHGVSLEELEETYNKFCENNGGSYGSIDKDEFLDAICHKGLVYA